MNDFESEFSVIRATVIELFEHEKIYECVDILTNGKYLINPTNFEKGWYGEITHWRIIITIGSELFFKVRDKIEFYKGYNN